MNILRGIYSTVIEALFPTSSSEKELFSYTPGQACATLPSAPKYAGLTVALPDVHSIFAYKDPRVTQLIWNIKYKKSACASGIGGYALFSSLKKYPQAILVPMPITSQRRKERGYNQCELLVDEIERLDMQKQFTVMRDILIRTHHDSRHTLKNRSERLESAQGIFGVNEMATQKIQSGEYKHIPIIVIDDVITTGSTMKEAMDTLKKYGFEKVSGLSLAH